MKDRIAQLGCNPTAHYSAVDRTGFVTSHRLLKIEEWIKTNSGKRPSRAEVSAAVRNIKNYKGVTGLIQFDNKGDPLKAKYFVLQNMISRFRAK